MRFFNSPNYFAALKGTFTIFNSGYENGSKI